MKKDIKIYEHDKDIKILKNTTIPNINNTLNLKAEQSTVNDLQIVKADKDYVDTITQSLASGSPKGTYTTVSDLQLAFPNGNSNIYITTDNGNWNYWDGSSWKSGGVYQGTEIPDKSITPIKTSFINIGKNLFNKTTVTAGKFVDYTTGLLKDNSSYYASDYIKIQGNAVYTVNFKHQMAFYDSGKNYISGITGDGSVQNVTFATPSNAFYMRMATKYIDTLQIEKGSSSTIYESYQEKISTQYIPQISESMMLDGAVSKNKLSFLERKNIFNKSLVIKGYFVSYSTGTLMTNSSYYASDFIPVQPNTTYTQNTDGQMAFYDSNKNYISGITGDGSSSQPKTYTTPSNASYIRCSMKNIDIFQVEVGDKATEYMSYDTTYIPLSLLPNIESSSDEILLFLPNEICVAVGRTIELYNNQVAWCGNVNNFHFKWDCQVGSNLKRKFSVKGITIGEYPLTLTVYDNNMNEVKKATSVIKIVSNTISTSKNVLCIGDSLTNTTSTPKVWMSEIRNLTSNNINFVGTRGLVAGEMHEGRSGFSSGNYLTASAYPFENEGVQPFWDGTRFNWNYYKTNTGINPNAVQIWLGTNGITLDPSINASNIKQMVDYIRQDDSSIPIFVVFTLYRGNQDGLGVQTSVDGYASNRGAWKLQEDRKVYNLMVKLYELLNTYSNLHFIPISLCHDSEYNFGAVSKPVNPRATQTELMPTEATHPQEQGYLQIADIISSTYAKYLNS